MTDTAKPPEIAFRDHEYRKLQEALETWEEWPDQEQREEVRRRTRNYVHAQMLVDIDLRKKSSSTDRKGQ